MDFRTPKTKAARVFKDKDHGKALALVALYKEAGAPVSCTLQSDGNYTVRVYVWKDAK